MTSGGRKTILEKNWDPSQGNFQKNLKSKGELTVGNPAEIKKGGIALSRRKSHEKKKQ